MSERVSESRAWPPPEFTTSRTGERSSSASASRLTAALLTAALPISRCRPSMPEPPSTSGRPVAAAWYIRLVRSSSTRSALGRRSPNCSSSCPYVRMESGSHWGRPGGSPPVPADGVPEVARSGNRLSGGGEVEVRPELALQAQPAQLAVLPHDTGHQVGGADRPAIRRRQVRRGHRRRPDVSAGQFERARQEV